MIYLENMLFFNIFFITEKTLILDDFGFFDVIFLIFYGRISGNSLLLSLVLNGIFLAMFLTSQPKNFDATAHTGAPEV